MSTGAWGCWGVWKVEGRVDGGGACGRWRWVWMAEDRVEGGETRLCTTNINVGNFQIQQFYNTGG